MNPFAVVQNNVFATSTLALLAQRFDVARLIMISTDKAVSPESIIGTSKRLAERVLLGMPASVASMGSIRLGNVLGSEGSVVTRFLAQIARGGAVTVTDPDVERFFLTREETVQRVLACAASGPGDGAIAIPVAGAPIRIVDLLRYLIEQASAKDLEITHTGLGPDDKLQEQFVSDREAVLGSPCRWRRMDRQPRGARGETRCGKTRRVEYSSDDTNLSQLLTVLTRLVPEYQPSSFLLQPAGVPVAH